jgi:hypothetical protein
MKCDDKIRRLLREADPAADRLLTPADRARMRAAVTSAALGGARRSSNAPLLAFGVALAAVAVAVAVIAIIPRSDRRSAPAATRPTREAPAAPAPSARAVVPTTEPVLAKLPARAKPAHARPRLARLDNGRRITRIVFTAPEGTRILWFVGSPDAKELGS